MFRRVPLAMLTEGLVLASSVHDDNLRLLLGAGVAVTHDVIVSLHKRDIRTVVVTEKDWQRISAFTSQGKAKNAAPNRSNTKTSLENDASRELDGELTDLKSTDIVPSENPFSANLKKPPALTRYERQQMDRMLDQHHNTVDQVESLLGGLSEGKEVSSEALQNLTRESLMRAAEDLDLFVCMGINPGENASFFTHSTHVSTLAVAIGATLGLDEKSLCDLGTGCLVHDAGMLKINPQFYETKQTLGPEDFCEIAKHPIISADMLYKNMKQVPVGVRMIEYQMHERGDGSGYPRGCTAEKIHPLAKIASVADSYVALVSPRPHRPALLPYHAITKMLKDVKEGLYDSTVVRGLLHTISLFPIGSFVELSDGRVGKTIRANGPSYDRPVVETWQRNNLSAAPDVCDLSENSELKVVKALTTLG